MRVRTKFFLGFAVIVFLIIILDATGIYITNETSATLRIDTAHSEPIINAAAEISSYAKRAEGHMMLFLALHNTTDREKFFKRIQSLHEQMQILDKMMMNPEARNILKNIKSQTDDIERFGTSLLELYDNETKETGKFNIEKHAELVRKFTDTTSSVREEGVKITQLETQLNTKTHNDILGKTAAYYYAIIAITAAIFLFSVFFAASLFRTILTPVIALKKSMSDLGGKTARKIRIMQKDEIGELAAAFNSMMDQLEKSRKETSTKTKMLEQARTYMETKVKDLTDTKKALLNMMEDSDDANKKLAVAKQELMKNLARLKELDLKKDEFISIAAHELKTPLTSIHGFSQLLLNESVAKDKQKRDKYLEIIESETKRLSNLVTEILELSRVDLGTIKFVIEEVNINNVLDDVKREMNVQIQAKGLKPEYEIDKKLPKIYTDRERLVQIMMNLINNSVKYTLKGEIKVRVSRENQYVHFCVQDTGIGIPKEHHEKIFQRFYQVDSSYTRKSGGTGLGLSICKEFVNALGGDIWFRSAAGKGSEFHFTLPIKSKEVVDKYGKISPDKK
jgi:signal transduction histidine kinase